MVFLFVILFLSLFPIIFLVKTNKKKKWELLNVLAKSFHGRVTGTFIQPAVEADYQKSKFSVVLSPHIRSSPKYLRVTLYKNTFFRLSVYKESVSSDVSKMPGLVHKIKLYDEAFDREFLMFSDKPQQLGGYFNNEDAKEAIQKLFSAGFNEILIDGNSAFTKKPNYDMEIDLGPIYIRTVLQCLNVIAKWADA